MQSVGSYIVYIHIYFTWGIILLCYFSHSLHLADASYSTIHLPHIPTVYVCICKCFSWIRTAVSLPLFLRWFLLCRYAVRYTCSMYAVYTFIHDMWIAMEFSSEMHVQRGTCANSCLSVATTNYNNCFVIIALQYITCQLFCAYSYVFDSCRM